MQLSDKQKEFWLNADHRWNIKTGATRSGKTWLDYYMIPRRIRAVKSSGHIVLLGNTRGTLKRNIIDPMRELYGEKLVGNIGSDNTVKLFGRRAYCLGADKVSQVSKIQGAAISYCYGDEITTWNEEVFQMLKSRLSESDSVFDGTCNPDSPDHWFKRFLDSDGDIYQQHYTIDDNPYLPEKFVSELKKEYAGTVFYNRFILGQWMRAEGLVYPMFTEERFVSDQEVKNPLNFRYAVSCDYGTVNPCVFLLWRYNEDETVKTVSLVKEYYWDSRKEKRQKTDEQYYEDLLEFVKIRDESVLVDAVIVDPSAASFIEVIRQKGSFNVWKANNEVIDGIRTTGNYLNAGVIGIDPSCVSTISEFHAYSWDDQSRQDAVIKEHDHAMDAMRYFVMSALRQEIRL